MSRPQTPDFGTWNSLRDENRSIRLFSTLLILMASAFWKTELCSATPLSTQEKGQGAVKSENTEIINLEPGKPIGRMLSAGDKHTYQVMLSQGQYASVIAEQRGMDVVVRLMGANGKALADVDAEVGTTGRERVELIAESDGYHRLVVEGKGRAGTASGSYEISLAELRVATERDRSLQQARKLYEESIGLRRAGKYDEALGAGQRGLEIVERVQGPNHPDVAAALNNLGETYRLKSDYDKAEPLHKRALEIREKALGPEHLYVAYSLNNLGLLYYDKGDLAKAEMLNRRALEIKEKTLGPDHIDLANSINNIALVYSDRREYIKAEAYYQRALKIREKALGPNHPDVAASYNNLAVLSTRKGDYAKAILLNEKALAIREKSLPPGHPSIASSLNNLAINYFNRGDFLKAEELDNRALEMREKALGPDHLNVAYSLNNLAENYRVRGYYERAEPLYERAIKIKEKVLGPEHPDLASSVNNLAFVYYARHDLEKAEFLYNRAKEIFEKARGPEHPDVAHPLEGLALIAIDRGDGAKAEQLYERVLEIRQKALGPDHPDVATALARLATLYVADGDSKRALAAERRANEIAERNIAINLATGSEREKLAYLASLAQLTDQTISLHLRAAPESSEARQLAATAILQRKGRVLDAMSDSIGALRRRLNSEDQTLLDTLNDTTTRLSGLVLGGPQRLTVPEHQNQVKAVEAQREKLESEISRRSAGYYQNARPITLADVQAVIPTDAALIEFSIYNPSSANPADRDKYPLGPRYAAYVVRHDGDLQSKELGEAKQIDAAIDGLRYALRDPKRQDVRRLARALDEMLIQPLRPLLGNAMRLLVSPDGALNLIPFEVLVDEQNRYLIEVYSVSYLSSGRDLLRLGLPRSPKSAPLIVTNPMFGEPDVARAGQAKGEMVARVQSNGKAEAVDAAPDLSGIYFAPLEATAEEGRAIKSLFPDASVLTREQATESALKRAEAPRIVHIATHGFFLQSTTDGVRNPITASTNGASVNIENPLLRSGLALSGANLRSSGADDGVLTALEASGLNLWGTKLVALSACDTGLGEVRNGEGVYGLRRAFVLAGTETLVMSLWPVSDYVTRELMTAYYKGLRQGLGRGEALRRVKLDMLKRKERQHPFYWASFIQSGEWANLEGKR